ncbi:MAG: L,D-transpeptidase [Gemmatimonadetes bacterium]|nr:L,D-transpeptidase [Gemmatimonadota bacterium]
MRNAVRNSLTIGVAVLALGALARPLGGQTLFALGETAALDFSGTMAGSPYYAPGSDEVYLHVDVGDKRLRVMKDRRVLHDFPVAVGKGYFLRPDASEQGWHFATPTGVFSVGRKEEDPVWYAPDWHFIEKGLRVPAADSRARYFPGEMGDYALYLGDGLAIHGTKYENTVGRASSHGCLRMRGDHISTIYPMMKIGTKVIITS